MTHRFQAGRGLRWAVIAVVGALVASSVLATSGAAARPAAPPPAPDGALVVPTRARCGPGSSPETGVQGQVPKADRTSGRSAQGYRCNLGLVGQYQGQGAGVVSPSHGTCAYFGSMFPGNLTGTKPGVPVVDASNPARPRLSTTLSSPAMVSGTWEGLKVHEGRGLLAAAGVPLLVGNPTFDVYDVSGDCSRPRLLNGIGGTRLTAPIATVGHEGGWSPDGRTYWATAGVGGWVTAIDVGDPTHPKVIFSGSTGLANHGFSFSADGNRMYGVTPVPAGMQVFDVSDIQARRPFPQVRQLGSVNWLDGLHTQHTIPFTSHGKPYVVAVDEGSGGSVRIIDIADERHPRIAKRYRLEINLPENTAKRSADIGGDGIFGYEAHYCTLDRPTDPTAMACGFFQSGIRVFDVRDPWAPKEIAYFNPPAQTGLLNLLKLRNSPHVLQLLFPALASLDSLLVSNLGGALAKPSMTTDNCSSPPRFVGADQLWVTCSDNGFLALRFTNGAYRAP